MCVWVEGASCPFQWCNGWCAQGGSNVCRCCDSHSPVRPLSRAVVCWCVSRSCLLLFVDLMDTLQLQRPIWPSSDSEQQQLGATAASTAAARPGAAGVGMFCSSQQLPLLCCSVVWPPPARGSHAVPGCTWSDKAQASSSASWSALSVTTTPHLQSTSSGVEPDLSYSPSGNTLNVQVVQQSSPDFIWHGFCDAGHSTLGCCSGLSYTLYAAVICHVTRSSLTCGAGAAQVVHECNPGTWCTLASQLLLHRLAGARRLVLYAGMAAACLTWCASFPCLLCVQQCTAAG